MSPEEQAKILVIEDIYYLRNDVMDLLRFEGFDVRGAENGLVGVQVARDYMPDLIVCDIMMPEMDGYEVLEVLRSERETSTIPFIFLTAKTDRIDVRQGMGKGADDYVTKPFLGHELMETIRMQLRKQAERREKEKAALDALRENISTALPHELRTPLNTIIGFSDMLTMEASEISPPVITEWAQHINLAALRLYRLVENYLTYVRIETLAREPHRTSTLHTQRSESAAATVEYQAMMRAQQVQREADLHLSADVSGAVVVGEQDLAKIVDELLDNAFKFSEPGQPVALNLQVEPDGKMLLITVTDRGRGMTREQIAAVGAYMQFERWFYEQQGSGLGLVIARRLTELYQGTLTMQSTVNEGTTVTVRLPMANG